MRRAWAAFDRHDGFKQTAIVLVALGVYEAARSLIEPDWTAAIANAERIAELERGLSFAWEQSLQRAFLGVPELIEFASAFYTLNPGDIIVTGTPEGVSPIEPGDTIVATIEKIGSMEVKARAA